MRKKLSEGTFSHVVAHIKVGFKGYTFHGHFFLLKKSLQWMCKTKRTDKLWAWVSTELICTFLHIKRIYDGVEAETRKSQASFQIIQVSSEALPRMRLE